MKTVLLAMVNGDNKQGGPLLARVDDTTWNKLSRTNLIMQAINGSGKPESAMLSVTPMD